jgi:hypothetical protein
MTIRADWQGASPHRLELGRVFVSAPTTSPRSPSLTSDNTHLEGQTP